MEVALLEALGTYQLIDKPSGIFNSLLQKAYDPVTVAPVPSDKSFTLKARVLELCASIVI